MLRLAPTSKQPQSGPGGKVFTLWMPGLPRSDETRLGPTFKSYIEESSGPSAPGAAPLPSPGGAGARNQRKA